MQSPKSSTWDGRTLVTTGMPLTSFAYARSEMGIASLVGSHRKGSTKHRNRSEPEVSCSVMTRGGMPTGQPEAGRWYRSSTLGAEAQTPAQTWQSRIISRHLDLNSIVQVRQLGYVVDTIQVVRKKGRARPRSQKLSDYPSETEPDSVPPLSVS